MGTFVFVLLVAAVAAVFVALPARRKPSQIGERLQAPGDDRGHLALIERRDRALAAVKELEFDHRTGRMSDFDYYELLPSLRLEAAQALNLLVEVEQDARQRHVHGRPPQPAEIDRDLEVASPR